MTGPAYRLQLESGPYSGQVYDLTASSLTIGRYPLADIVIDDPGIAYRHALLTRAGDTYRIADLASDSGTYVNGHRIGAEPVLLSPGDIILLGSRLTATYLVVDKQLDTFESVESPAAVEELALPPAEELQEATGEYDPPVWEEPQPTDDAASPVIHPEPLPPMPPPHRSNGRIMAITAVIMVALLACCCSATLFMYFIGGDWLLNQLGYLP